MAIEISELWIYPIKSARGARLESAVIGPAGIENDRRWMVVDEAGRAITQRERPEMALVTASVSGGVLQVSAPGMPDLTVAAQAEGPKSTVKVWSSTPLAIVDNHGSGEWFSEYLRTRASLVHRDDEHPRLLKDFYQRPGASAVVGFADFASLHLTSQTSLDELNTKTGKAIDMSRFRPNIVVSGAVPFAEDSWASNRLGSITTHTVRGTSRCVITDTDQATALRSPEVLQALAQVRRGSDRANPNHPRGLFFGQYLSHEGPFPVTVSQGEAVEVLALALEPNVSLDQALTLR